MRAGAGGPKRVADPGGRGEPDCAAIVAAIEACTGTTCRQIVGKPDPNMVTQALAGLDVRDLTTR